MATVFLAQDLRHERPVALKVLHLELAHALGPERFQREIKLAARLQHPHILSVHDSGETAGQLWFTMPFVQGESIRQRLRREKQLPIEEALRIASEVARALDYAHRQGVIHRDIKPENILLTSEGDTLVADFGIGRVLGAAAAGDKLTETGMVVGTPAYMSPEQGAGERELDGRTDIYSLGVVLYEMLAGEPPYTGPTAQAMLVKRLSDPVPDVRRARASVPEGTEQALRKALSPVPADRFTSPADFARALAAPAATARAPATVTTTLAESVGPAVTAPTLRVAAVPPTSAEPTRPAAPGRRLPFAALTLGLGILIGLGVLFAWRRTHTPGGEAPGPKRLAVLPFENLGDPADAYFADGITDEVRGKLAQVSGLAVIARASSNEYRRTAKPPQQIARELGADYLLTATVRWEKAPGGQSRVRVSPELVRVEPGAAPTTKWQRPFDAQLTDVFQVQADIATKVASALDAALGDSARRELAARPTTSLPAYDAFLRGEEVSAGLATADLPTLRRAVGYYAEAVALDSAFAPAWAQLGRAHALLYNNGIPAPADAEQARRAAERAVALAPARPEGHLALGVYYLLVRSDPSRALAELAVGRRAAPNNADLLTVSAIAEEALGRWDAGLAHLRQAAVLDPRAVLTARRLARTLLWLRRYPEAMRESDRALALAPASLGALEDRAMMRLAQGDLAGARAVLRAAIKEVEPAALVANLANYWDLYWVLDDEQQRLLLRLRPGAFDDNRAVWGLCLAETYALRGGLARARAYADSARAAFEAQLRATPGDAQAHVLHGVALAYLGRNAEAVREGERGLALSPITKDAYNGAYFQHQLARIYLLVGEPEKALDRLEPLLTIPYYLTPSWLKIDPTFAPLRGNPRYERLVASK